MLQEGIFKNVAVQLSTLTFFLHIKAISDANNKKGAVLQNVDTTNCCIEQRARAMSRGDLQITVSRLFESLHLQLLNTWMERLIFKNFWKAFQSRTVLQSVA